jgi:hypothetical protein
MRATVRSNRRRRVEMAAIGGGFATSSPLLVLKGAYLADAVYQLLLVHEAELVAVANRRNQLHHWLRTGSFISDNSKLTMTTTDSVNDEIRLTDLLLPLVLYRRRIWQLTLALVAVTVLTAGIYFVVQPTLWSASLEIRPTFEGADDGEYPNGLKFGVADIVAPSVVEAVHSKNDLKNYCPVEVFRAGLTVQESSTALQLLDAEYLARLQDVRLTPVERQRLQDEYAARRLATPRSYRVGFIRPFSCATLPDQSALKVLTDVLEEWAAQSHTRRGVLNIRTARLTPEIFELRDVGGMSLLLRATTIRSAISRVVENISEVQQMPGSELVRGGNPPRSLAEVKVRLEDLAQLQLDPLVALGGSAIGDRSSVRWLTSAMESEVVRQRAVEARAETMRQALREYSGVPVTPVTPARSTSNQVGSDVQTLTPQIDRTFIEGIVELSAPNTAFRQALTQRIITAAAEAVSHAETVERYRWTLAALNRNEAQILPADEVLSRMEAIRKEAQAVTRTFDEIYEEFSRVAFRAGSAMYRIDSPTQVTALRAFSLRSYLLLIIGVSLSAPIILGLVCLVLFHLRRYVRSTVTA